MSSFKFSCPGRGVIKDAASMRDQVAEVVFGPRYGRIVYLPRHHSSQGHEQPAQTKPLLPCPCQRKKPSAERAHDKPRSLWERLADRAGPCEQTLAPGCKRTTNESVMAMIPGSSSRMRC